ncbi:sigma-E factor negative regulatory protein [Paraburkholderia sp. SIMBA_055]|jgi:sigma-E factor negative regulatory protein RseA|uniref:Anti sigma-E protein, RseA n=2 Tax=Paraburkholderia graminis TaxID=60548 RepID=B1G7R3_PARG4|nr:sigma-E factor negative regulatory protein [Paraburkholderia graminis]ALE55492.1 anti-sigma factor [Burkholderia sp. HB1]AXF09877.1 anti-sigma factor [Paraburkholderia graminis]EDT07790.1 anti sigma-E protein, RseA [Paraburkholderia graminis C4D1M]MDQ0623937.1 sigma-E factor negative regulatory protein RseA [Paraburkholderia graminis]MDR6203105.1 sigma-E factor negative regulatory protein RseA [Paraburkholderia graminis]
MGSVSMQSQASSRGERLSAFVDGELFGEEHLNVDKFVSELDGEDRAAWSSYHLIGDALRSDDLAVGSAASNAFLSGFAARFESEPHLLAPSAQPVTRRLLALRRRVVPAFAVAAAAATLTWIVVPQLQGVPGGPGATQVASVSSHGDALQKVAMASVPSANVMPVAQDANIIRDASLDQYLEAHQQFAQQPVMPGSMPLIRAAAVSTQGQ